MATEQEQQQIHLQLQVHELKVKRGQIKAQLTRMKTFVEQFDETNVIGLQIRLEKTQELWEKFETVQDKIELLQPETDDNERADFEASYFTTVVKAGEIIGAKKDAINAAIPITAPEASTTSSTITNIPKLKLPIFSGDIMEWTSFKNSFMSIISLQHNLPDLQKLQYLRGQLKGDPLQCIQALQTTAENYSVAWKLLTARYENKRLIINMHVKALYDIQPVGRENCTALRHFIDSVRVHISSLEAIGEPVKHWDTLIVFLLNTKIDFQTRKEWENKVNDKHQVTTMPTLEEFLDFLNCKCQTLDITNRNTSEPKPFKKPDKKFALTATTSSHSCNYCNKSHLIYYCEDFLKLPISRRHEEAKKLQLCLNCLRTGHSSVKCRSSTCRKCSRRHNSLLHFEIEKTSTLQIEQVQPTNDTDNMVSQYDNSVTTHCTQDNQTHVFLSTAQVYVSDKERRLHACRVLLDSGSQSNFITQNLCDTLQTGCKTISLPVVGINRSSTTITKSTKVTIKSIFNNYEDTIQCLVVPTITGKLPQVKVNIDSLSIPVDINLADDHFNIPGVVDILIGADTFWKILCSKQIKLLKNQPCLQQTKLGWIVSGPISTCPPEQPASTCHLSLEDQMEQFWKIETIDERKHLTKEEEACEQHFQTHTVRDITGRFIVSLPFRTTEVQLGDSYQNALRRFHQLERKLNTSNKLKQHYVEFMEEYLRLQHMHEVSNDDKTIGYYIPHHAITKESSLSTKVRVVFDASAATSNGVSLNQTLMVGPTIQEDLFTILLRFRQHAYVLTADVEKMYRQVKVSNQDTVFQKILWRSDPTQEIKTYQLDTVSYGTSSAPFLAVRCLRELAELGSSSFPLASSVIKRDFYVDDVLTGSDYFEEARQLKHELSDLLSQGGFKLRKWLSNHKDLLGDANETNKDHLFQLDMSETIKTLGLHWNANEDVILYQINIDTSGKLTKRILLSQIARLFDPLGLLGPIIAKAKMIMQDIWQLKISWDERLPEEISSLWSEYQSQLQILQLLKIPRHTITPNAMDIQLHGFCDASEKGYAACLYIRSIDINGCCTSSMICSKSRVAPLKRISLPRLELCGALLLSQLYESTIKALDTRFNDVFLWSDSTIVIHWINTPAQRLKTFVANRVSEIQRLTNAENWFHVKSGDNPADILSRGCLPEQLINSEIWWTGPRWLQLTQAEWPIQQVSIDASSLDLELRKEVICTAAVIQDPLDILHRYSSFDKLTRVIAYCHRFINNCRTRNSKFTRCLTRQELETATTSIVKMVQQEHFAREIRDLASNNQVDRRSKLTSLTPFLDQYGAIRVGGRLLQANIHQDQKHPWVLPSTHVVTLLIIESVHKRLLHASCEQVLAAVRMKFWPLSGRQSVKKVIRQCVQCFRMRPKPLEHLMGNLPDTRVNISSRPFAISGVDYAGPIQIRESRRRGRICTSKAYIAVFVCFTTKAVHLELVSQLTTEAFLSALKRFVARRGMCNKLYSDNATNFVGANRHLKECYDFISDSTDIIASELSNQKIEWSFIPPRSPHFGGIWEAAVKATKRHFYTITRNLMLTFEECYTLLTGIEACLNCRPLTPISSDPNDLTALTPSHFLIGDSLLQPSENNFISTPDNRLSRWQHIDKIKQHFWNRWSREYLHQLQTKTKWSSSSENLKIGTMVLVMDDNLPPLRWSLARISSLHPGDDGVVRVVTLKTSAGEVKRAVRKLCALPSVD